MDKTITTQPAKTDAEYTVAIEELLAGMNSALAQMDKTSAESEVMRANTVRLAASNAAALRDIKAQLNALRR